MFSSIASSNLCQKSLAQRSSHTPFKLLLVAHHRSVDPRVVSHFANGIARLCAQAVEQIHVDVIGERVC